MALAFLALRITFLRADPPEVLPHEINTSEDFFVEPTAKAHEARNRAVHGEWHTHPADQYQFWRAQSPCWVYPMSWVFRAFGTSYTTLRAFSVTVALAGFLCLAMLSRDRPEAWWAGALLLTVNFYAICYDRSGLIEVMVSTAIAAMVLCLDRAREDPLWLVGSQVAFGIAFFAKQGAIYGFPVLVVFNLALFVRHLRAAREGRAQHPTWRVWAPVISAAVVAAVALAVIASPDYQRALKWNYRHMMFSREQQADAALKVEAFAWRLTDFSRVHKGYFGLWPLAGLLALGATGHTLVCWISGREVDERRRLLVAWLACAWIALNLSRQTDTRFFAILVLPVHMLAGEAVGLWTRWGRGQPRPRATVTAAGIVVGLAAALHLAYFGWWARNRSYEIVDFNAKVARLVTEPDAVVIGRWSAPLVHETDVHHYYVKWGFNTDLETMAAFRITHAIWREKHEETHQHLRKFQPAASRYEVLATQTVRGEKVQLVRFTAPLDPPGPRPARTPAATR